MLEDRGKISDIKSRKNFKSQFRRTRRKYFNPCTVNCKMAYVKEVKPIYDFIVRTQTLD